jgi:competence protein ComEC
MFQLKTGYFISGIITGLIFLFSFLIHLPDGTMHIYFCSVGQGDGAYITFPDGRDMIVDGGPDNSILQCLSRHMPFWDRHINIVVSTHPQKDHLQGLLSVVERYDIDYIVRSDIANSTDGYKKFISLITQKHIPVHYVVTGDAITIGKTTIHIIWPTDEEVASFHPIEYEYNQLAADVLGVQDTGNVNDAAVVFWLQYGSFDGLFTADADTRVEGQFTGSALPDGQVEVLKVPHHGSKTGMNQAFVDWVAPKLAVISVGKNTFGHPSAEAIHLLQSVGARVLRTDQLGDIEVVSDGKTWGVREKK